MIGKTYYVRKFNIVKYSRDQDRLQIQPYLHHYPSAFDNPLK